jgi:hypothetical protein
MGDARLLINLVARGFARFAYSVYWVVPIYSQVLIVLCGDSRAFFIDVDLGWAKVALCRAGRCPPGSPFQIITSRHFFHFYFLRTLRTIGFSGSRLKPFRWCPQPACDTSLHQITSVWFVLRCVFHPKLSNHPGRATARTILIVSKWIGWGSAQRRSWALGCSNWNPSGNLEKHQNAANLCVPTTNFPAG